VTKELKNIFLEDPKPQRKRSMAKRSVVDAAKP
jgi:hypothetical protein